MAVTWCMPDVTALICSSSDDAPSGTSFGILAPRRLLSDRHGYTGRTTRQEGPALARGPGVRDLAWRYRRRRLALHERGGDPGRTPEPGPGGGGERARRRRDRAARDHDPRGSHPGSRFRGPGPRDRGRD